MAKRYTATITIACLKEHVCSTCDNVYAYPFRRTLKAVSGGSAAQAQARVRTMADKSVKADVHSIPCPACGMVQPDMIGRARVRSFKFVLLVGVVLPVTVLLILKAIQIDGLNSDRITWALAIVATVATVVMLGIELPNPNSNPENNRRKISGRVSTGEIRSGQTDAANQSMLQQTGPSRPALVKLVVLLLIASIPIAMVPELIRGPRGWVVNAGLFPPVVGPGDSFDIRMPDSITSIKGFCRGTATATIRDIDGNKGPGPNVVVTATTDQDDWGSTISAKSEEKSTSHRPKVTISIPSDPTLANHTVQCAINLSLEYPTITSGGSSFEVATSTMNHNLPIRLSTPGAGAKYNSIWWACTLLSVAILLGGVLILMAASSNLRRAVTVSNVYPL